VLEALLKRGSSVVLVCSEADGRLGRAEVARLSDLYSAQRIQMATIQGQCARGRDIDKMMAEARDKLGNISFIVNSHNCLYKEFPRHLESLAIKYMGTDDGGPGGVLLHVHSNTGELAHTNVEERVARLLGQGVKECGVVRPGVEFPDSEQVHITDDQHSPCSQHNKNSNYVRDYTGYMTVHTALTCPPGSTWAFDRNFKVVQL